MYCVNQYVKKGMLCLHGGTVNLNNYPPQTAGFHVTSDYHQ